MEEFGVIPDWEVSFLKHYNVQLGRFKKVKELSPLKRGIHALDIVGSYL